MMNILRGVNSTAALHTRIGDIFVFVHKGDIIRIVEIKKDKDIIELD